MIEASKEEHFQRGMTAKGKQTTAFRREYWLNDKGNLCYKMFLGVENNPAYEHLNGELEPFEWFIWDLNKDINYDHFLKGSSSGLRSPCSTVMFFMACLSSSSASSSPSFYCASSSFIQAGCHKMTGRSSRKYLASTPFLWSRGMSRTAVPVLNYEPRILPILVPLESFISRPCRGRSKVRSTKRIALKFSGFMSNLSWLVVLTKNGRACLRIWPTWVVL